MWIFLSLVLLITTGFYIFIRPFRQGVNNLVAGILIWLYGQTQNAPGWTRALVGWLNRTGSAALAGAVWAAIRLLWWLGFLTVAYAYGIHHAQSTGSYAVLMLTMGLNALTLLIVVQFSSTVSGWLGTSRAFTQTMATLFMIYSLHAAMLLQWTELYLAYMGFLIIATLVITFFFHVSSIYFSWIGKSTGYILIILFSIIMISPLLEPELKTWQKKRAIAAQKKETSRTGLEMERKYAENRVPKIIKMDANLLFLTGVETKNSVLKGEIIQVVNGDTATTSGVPVRYVEKFVGAKMVSSGYLPFWVIDFDSSPEDWTNSISQTVKKKPKSSYREYRPQPVIRIDETVVSGQYTSLKNSLTGKNYIPRPGERVYIYPYSQGLVAKLGSGVVAVLPRDDESGVKYGRLNITKNVRGKPLMLRSDRETMVDSIHVY